MKKRLFALVVALVLCMATMLLMASCDVLGGINFDEIQSVIEDADERFDEAEKNIADVEQSIGDTQDKLTEVEGELNDAKDKISDMESELGNLVGDGKFTVSFNTNGGGKIPDQSVQQFFPIVKPADPIKVGYVFDGWYIDGEKWIFERDGVLDDLTLEAKWVLEEYTLTFAIGEDVDFICVDTAYKSCGTTFTYTADDDILFSFGTFNVDCDYVYEIWKAGYNFIGWTWNGQSEPVRDINIEKGTVADITLVPNFKPILYTISYETYYGEIPSNMPTSYTVEDEVVIPNLSDGPGVVFSGWGLNGSSNYSKNVVIPKGSTGSKTYTAYWNGRNNTVVNNWWDTVAYDETTLRFQLTECQNAGLHPNTKRLLEGREDASGGRLLDELITERNENAYFNTNVTIVYNYYNNNTELYGWGKAMDVIYQEVQNKSQYSPDMYCNFMSDMLATSLKGSFANILSQSRNSAGTGRVSNFFKVDPSVKNEGYEHSGYMSDLMSSLTLSDEKFYVIASDYFIDLIRAMFVVPVNRQLFNSIASTTIADLDNSGASDMNDLFVEVKNNDWTYDKLMEYSAAVAVDVNNNTVWDSGDVLGFGLDYLGGMMASGLMYSSNLVIIEKNWDEDQMKYTYVYPDRNPELDVFVGKINTVFNSKGIAAIDRGDATSAVEHIANKFTGNSMLFGGIITLGNLENAEYQVMKGEDKGFGVVPVPVYTNIDPETGVKYALDNSPYQTQIHTSGGAGGISHVTSKFTQCSAFIQYQSTHSTDILNEYYDNNLTLDVADGMKGNVEMLQYIRNNVRTSFDKLFEDAIAFFNKQVDENAQANRWHNVLMTYQYKLPSMADLYDSLISTKKTRLANLVNEYTKLPD